MLRRLYNSTYSNITGQFKLYLESLPTDQIDQTENYIKAEWTNF